VEETAHATRRRVPRWKGARPAPTPPPSAPACARLRGEPGNVRRAASPPAVWEAFATQSAWKSWAIAGLLVVLALVGFAAARLASRPPEVVLVDAGGSATPVRRSIATEALLHFIADHTRPPDVAVVRFTRDFLRLALAWNSSTIDVDWPEALARMAPELRSRVQAEATARRLVETWRAAQRRTDLVLEDLVVEDRAGGQIAVRASLRRVARPLLGGDGDGTDRLRVELIERPLPPTLERPDGLEVVEWRLTPVAPNVPSGTTPPLAAR